VTKQKVHTHTHTHTHKHTQTHTHTHTHTHTNTHKHAQTHTNTHIKSCISCNTDADVIQAVAKFENSGLFPAADGNSYPFHVKGVISFTQIDSQTTRIHGILFSGI